MNTPSKLDPQSSLTFLFAAKTLRVVMRADEPWFVAADVCGALEIQNASQAVQALDDDERAMFSIGRQGDANIISESGLYTLILRCRGATKPGTIAHRFRKWVTSEVLPAVRRTGRYEKPAVNAPTALDAKLSPGQCLDLRRAVEKAVIRIIGNGGRTHRACGFSSAWARVHDYFNVSGYADIPAARFEEAMRLVASLRDFGMEQDSNTLMDDLSELVGFLRDDLHEEYLRLIQRVDEIDRVAQKHKLYRARVEPLPAPAAVLSE